MLHAVVDRERLDHEHLDFGNEQVREDHHMRRAVDHDFARFLVAIGGLHPRRVIRQPLFRGAKPAHRRVALAELGPQVDFGMAVAIVTRHGGRGAAIELPDRAVGDAEDRGMHEGRVIAVAFVFQDEFPVGFYSVLEEAGRDLDLTFR